MTNRRRRRLSTNENSGTNVDFDSNDNNDIGEESNNSTPSIKRRSRHLSTQNLPILQENEATTETEEKTEPNESISNVKRRRTSILPPKEENISENSESSQISEDEINKKPQVRAQRRSKIPNTSAENTQDSSIDKLESNENTSEGTTESKETPPKARRRSSVLNSHKESEKNTENDVNSSELPNVIPQKPKRRTLTNPPKVEESSDGMDVNSQGEISESINKPSRRSRSIRNETPSETLKNDENVDDPNPPKPNKRRSIKAPNEDTSEPQKIESTEDENNKSKPRKRRASLPLDSLSPRSKLKRMTQITTIPEEDELSITNQVESSNPIPIKDQSLKDQIFDKDRDGLDSKNKPLISTDIKHERSNDDRFDEDLTEDTNESLKKKEQIKSSESLNVDIDRSSPQKPTFDNQEKTAIEKSIDFKEKDQHPPNIITDKLENNEAIMSASNNSNGEDLKTDSFNQNNSKNPISDKLSTKLENDQLSDILKDENSKSQLIHEKLTVNSNSDNVLKESSLESEKKKQEESSTRLNRVPSFLTETETDSSDGECEEEDIKYKNEGDRNIDPFGMKVRKDSSVISHTIIDRSQAQLNENLLVGNVDNKNYMESNLLLSKQITSISAESLSQSNPDLMTSRKEVEDDVISINSNFNTSDEDIEYEPYSSKKQEMTGGEPKFGMKQNMTARKSENYKNKTIFDCIKLLTGHVWANEEEIIKKSKSVQKDFYETIINTLTDDISKINELIKEKEDLLNEDKSNLQVEYQLVDFKSKSKNFTLDLQIVEEAYNLAYGPDDTFEESFEIIERNLGLKQRLQQITFQRLIEIEEKIV